MTYQERGLGPPHFDENYQMWQRQMAAFLCGKGQIHWDVTVNTTYVYLVNFLSSGSRDMFDSNNKVRMSIRIRMGSDRGPGVQDLVGV
jgi:hypothetical protein